MRPTVAAGVRRLAAGRRDPTGLTRRQKRSPFREHRALLARGLFACAAFLFVVGGAWLVGTHNISGAARDGTAGKRTQAYRVGWIIHEQPDGMSCTYVPFDTATEQVGKPTTAMCESAARKQRASGQDGFAWGRD